MRKLIEICKLTEGLLLIHPLPIITDFSEAVIMSSCNDEETACRLPSKVDEDENERAFNNPSPEDIAKFALHHYDKVLPGNKGKPQKDREWTVYAAIVVSQQRKERNNSKNISNTYSELWVASCATGSKCCAYQPDNDGLVICDSHAEVLAKRGLQRMLWMEIEHGLKLLADDSFKGYNNDDDDAHRLLDMSIGSDNNDVSFILRKSVQLHMYISDSPCGDASIYNIARGKDVDASSSQNEQNFTGAKIVVSDKICPEIVQLPTNQSAIMIARENVQAKGELRLKSGRSNIPAHLRSTSHSCSDKLCLWFICGMQGLLLAQWIPQPIRLFSIMVSRDPKADINNGTIQECDQYIALHRALAQRALHTKSQHKHMKNILQVHIVDQHFLSGKTFSQASRSKYRRSELNNGGEPQPKIAKHSKILPAAGVSLNYQPTLGKSNNSNAPSWIIRCFNKDNLEVTVGVSGLKHGKKPKSKADVQRSSSRLCRSSLFNYASECSMQLAENSTINSSLKNKDDIDGEKIPYSEFKRRLPETFISKEKNMALGNSVGALSGWIRSEKSFLVRKI